MYVSIEEPVPGRVHVRATIRHPSNPQTRKIMAEYFPTTPATQAGARISRLRNAAWAAWNASYHTSFPDAYRMLSRSLYEEALHEQIEVLFAQLDRQNFQLDTAAVAGDVA